MTNKSLLLPWFTLFASMSVVAQTNNSDRCTVVLMDVTAKTTENVRSAPTRELGTFDTVVYEGEVTTRAFRLPNTKLFVVATVWYDDETLTSDKGADSVSLELLVSRTRDRKILRSLVFATAEVPLSGFDVARVVTMIRVGRRKQVVIMECRAQQRNQMPQ